MRAQHLRVEITDTLPDRLDGKWTAVVGHGMDFAPQIERAAKTHAGVHFLLTDDSGPSARMSFPNLCYVDWRWDEGAFLAGLLASHLTNSGTVGVLGGNPCSTQEYAMAGFVRGARFDRDDIVVLTAQSGSFHDVDRGFRLASAIFNEGADVLLHTANSCGRGAIKAAECSDRTMIGFLNEDDRAHSCVAAFIATDVEGALVSLLSAIASGQLLAGVVACGLASGYQQFELIRVVPDPVRRRIEELTTMITTGRLRIRAPEAAK